MNELTVIPKRGIPVTVTGTIEGARRWLDSARRLEEAKIFCQVMLGFELRVLWTAAIKHGGDRKSDEAKSSRKNCDLITHDQICEALKLSEGSIRNYMAMADGCAPRLRKLPGLQGFDPATTPIAALPEKTQTALTTAVRKLTDGKTQVEFMRELGIAKLPPGAGATGRPKGEGGRPPAPSLGEQAEIMREMAAKDWAYLDDLLLHGYRSKFTLLNDAQVIGQIAALETALGARKTWLKTPAEKRDPHAAEKQFPQSHA